MDTTYQVKNRISNLLEEYQEEAVEALFYFLLKGDTLTSTMSEKFDDLCVLIVDDATS